MADLDTLTYYSFLAIFCTAIILFFIKINEIAYTLMLMSILLIYIFNIVIEGKKSLGNLFHPAEKPFLFVVLRAVPVPDPTAWVRVCGGPLLPHSPGLCG